MIVLGLTGSIGMGKSEAAKSFANFGIPVFDSDACVHELFKNNDILKQAIADNFPCSVVDGEIDRVKLGAVVFNSPEKIETLERLVHPLVQEEQNKFLKEAKKTNAKIAVLDIPLLFETGANKRVDKVLVVSAPKHIQEERVLSREGMTREKFEMILAKQMSDKEKVKRADFIIKTDSGIETMQSHIKDLITKLSNNPES